MHRGLATQQQQRSSARSGRTSRLNTVWRLAPAGLRALHGVVAFSAPELVQTQVVAGAAAAEEATPAAPVKKQGWWEKSTPNSRDVNGIQELVDQLADAGDKLVVVEFYAPWCNACKALYPKVCQLMTEKAEEVLFLKVNFDINKDMCKTMGVKVLPMFHMYRGGEGRVAAFSCTVSKIQRLKDALDMYTAAFCSLEESPGVEEFPDVHAHAADVQLDVQPVAAVDRPTRLQGWF